MVVIILQCLSILNQTNFIWIPKDQTLSLITSSQESPQEFSMSWLWLQTWGLGSRLSRITSPFLISLEAHAFFFEWRMFFWEGGTVTDVVCFHGSLFYSVWLLLIMAPFPGPFFPLSLSFKSKLLSHCPREQNSYKMCAK